MYAKLFMQVKERRFQTLGCDWKNNFQVLHQCPYGLSGHLFNRLKHFPSSILIKMGIHYSDDKIKAHYQTADRGTSLQNGQMRTCRFAIQKASRLFAEA